MPAVERGDRAPTTAVESTHKVTGDNTRAEVANPIKAVLTKTLEAAISTESTNLRTLDRISLRKIVLDALMMFFGHQVHEACSARSNDSFLKLSVYEKSSQWRISVVRILAPKSEDTGIIPHQLSQGLVISRLTLVPLVFAPPIL